MILIEMLLVPSAVLVFAFSIFWLVPRLRRDRFQFRMIDLAEEVDSLIDSKVLSHTRYIEEVRAVVYHAAEHPEFARLREATWAFQTSDVGAVTPFALERERYGVEVGQAELYVADEIVKRLATDLLRQAFRGSMWPVWLVLFPALRARRAAQLGRAQQVLVAQFV